MRKFLDHLDQFIMFVLVVTLTVMLVVGTMQVCWRYILKAALSWSEELMRFLYVWATLLGVCCGIRRKSLACIDNLLDFVAKKSRVGAVVLRVAGYALQIFVLALLIVYGWQFTMRGIKQTSPALGISMALIYMAFPVGGALGLVYTLEEIYDTFSGKSRALASSKG